VDLGPHLIDGALVLSASLRASARQLSVSGKTRKSTMRLTLILQYPKLRATLRARIIAYAPSHHLLLHGTEGSFVKYGMDPQEEILRSEHCPDGTDWGNNWGLGGLRKRWGTLTRVSEQPRKIETERGDYRGFYATFEMRSRRKRLWMSRRNNFCVRNGRCFSHTRAAAKDG